MPLGTVLNCNGNRNEKIMSVDKYFWWKVSNCPLVDRGDGGKVSTL